jgi:hypothetical protein
MEVDDDDDDNKLDDDDNDGVNDDGVNDDDEAAVNCKNQSSLLTHFSQVFVITTITGKEQTEDDAFFTTPLLAQNR